MPKNLQLIDFVIRLLRNKIKQRLSDTFFSEKWSIGVVREPIHRFLEKGFVPPIHYIQGDGRTFLADPFGVKQEDELHIVCEEYELRIPKSGRLSTIKIDESFTKTEKNLRHHVGAPSILPILSDTMSQGFFSVLVKDSSILIVDRRPIWDT